MTAPEQAKRLLQHWEDNPAAYGRTTLGEAIHAATGVSGLPLLVAIFERTKFHPNVLLRERPKHELFDILREIADDQPNTTT